MDNAKQHWKILQKLGNDLEKKVRSFMVIGKDGDGVVVATEDGQAFWMGKMTFERGQTQTVTTPTPLDVPGKLVQMAQGDGHILLLNQRGEIYSMGRDDCGQLGLGMGNDNMTQLSPQLISIPHRITLVRCGYGHNLALTDDGKVWSWGHNMRGLYRFTTTFLSAPYQLSELDRHRIVSIDCGCEHSWALTDQGEVYSWGLNSYGQIGNHGGLFDTQIPTRILTPDPVRSIAAGSYHTLLLTRMGEVYACGNNDHGQLGCCYNDTRFSSSLSKVEDLPNISQIASNHFTNLSMAMFSDAGNKRCFVWGEMSGVNLMSDFLPQKLHPIYSTVQSPLSFFSTHRNISYSVTFPETPPPSLLSVRMAQMFDNPETADVQFVVERRTIHAHRNILNNSSDYFAQLFSQVDPKDPISKVTIFDYSYEEFYAFLRFLYTDSLEVDLDLIPEMFELATLYLEPDLQKLCLLRMSETISPATCCLYYPLTHRHSLPELATFQQELIYFASTRMWEVENSTAYKLMEPDLCYHFTEAVRNSSFFSF